MKNKLVLSFVAIWIGCGSLSAQTDYSNRQQLAQRIAALSSKHPQYVKTQSLAKTLGGSDIWSITIGTGQIDQKPAIAVVGGVEGKHLLGVEMAIGFAEMLLARADTDSIKRLLDTQTFYVFPNLSPDATEQYFASLQYERSGNSRPVDYDRDGPVGEDGYDDLDGDGKITYIRVEDPTGTYIVNPTEPRAMMLADASKGQQGRYLVFSEGIDNDKDGLLNEDGEEGIQFNKNSTYNYKNFKAGAGDYAVSELENRALFDFLYDAFNVYAVVSFGPYNNLSVPEQSALGHQADTPQTGRRPGGRKITSWSAADAKVSSSVSELYNTLLDTDGGTREDAGEGNFAEWAYYHYGRFSFSTPGWWVPAVADSTHRSSKTREQSGKNDRIAAYFRWADSEGISNTFAPWEVIDHPDFSGKKVEVGGVHPFVLHNPPYHLVEPIVRQHTDFLVALSAYAPALEVMDVKSEKLGSGLTRVSLKVFNSGLMPTLTEIGERSYFLKRVAVHVKTSGAQKVISGRPLQTLGTIGAREAVELNWIIQGNGKVSIEAGSLTTGTKKIELTL